MTATTSVAVRHALARAVVYRLLARAFGRPDGALQAALAGGELAGELRRAVQALGRRSASLRQALAGLETAGRGGDGLGREFVRLFNPSADFNCPPYETEYTASHVFMRTQQLADVAGFYRAFGLKVAAGFRERPDHIAAELEFMHVLTLKEARALAQGLEEKADICRDAQVKFVRDHLGRWLGPYCERLATMDEGFYGALAALAREFVALDARRLGVRPDVAAPRRPAQPEPETETELECPGVGGEARAAS